MPGSSPGATMPVLPGSFTHPVKKVSSATPIPCLRIWRSSGLGLYVVHPITAAGPRGLGCFGEHGIQGADSLQTRPIVFVCHSLGGLVVKQALIKAANYMNNNRHPSLGAIYSSTNGVVFMGTPHRGSSKEAYADVLIRIAKVTLRQPNEQLLRTLRQDSHILENQRDDFTTISQSMSIICIREELPTGIGVVSLHSVFVTIVPDADGWG